MTNLTQQDITDLLSMGYRKAEARNNDSEAWLKPFGFSICVFDTVAGAWEVRLRSIKGEMLLWVRTKFGTWKEGELITLLAYYERYEFQDHGGSEPVNSVPFGFMTDRDREFVYEMILERKTKSRSRNSKKASYEDSSVHDELVSRGWELWEMGGGSTAYGQVLPGGGYIQLVEVAPGDDWTGNAPSNLDDMVAIYKYLDDDERPIVVENFDSLRDFFRRRR